MTTLQYLWLKAMMLFWRLLFALSVVWYAIQEIIAGPYLGYQWAKAANRSALARLSLASDSRGYLLVGMTADDISLILKTGADGIDVLKAWCPPELCDKVESLIQLVMDFVAKAVSAFLLARDKVDFWQAPNEPMMEAVREFHEGVQALSITKEQLDTLRRLVHDVGEFQRTGDDVRTQAVMRGIANGWFLRRVAAWLLR